MTFQQLQGGNNLQNKIDMSKERLQEIAKELANNANMPYCWEDIYNRLIGGYPLPFKVKVE